MELIRSVTLLLFTMLSVGFPARATPAQQAVTPPSPPDAPVLQPETLTPKDVVLLRYRPRYTSLKDLYGLITDFYSRRLVFEDGRVLDNIGLIGDDLLLYDTPEHIQEMTDLLKQLDAPDSEGLDLESETVPMEDAKETVVRLAPDQVVLENYQPKKVDPASLFQTLKSFHGRMVQVGDRDPRWNLAVSGSSVLIYDAPEKVQTILDLCRKLDGNPVHGLSPDEFLSASYQPRYLSLDSVRDALRPFARQPLETQDGNFHSFQNLSFLEDSGTVVVRDTPDRVEKIQAFLDGLDVPQAQVLLSCMVLRAEIGTGAGDSGGLPVDLLDNLHQLLPDATYALVGTALLRTTVTPGTSLSLLAENDSDDYHLEMRIDAFDPENAALSVSKCRFSVLRDEVAPTKTASSGSPASHSRSRQELFDTSTTLHGGEYTVLGAVGSPTILVVLRLQPAD